MSFTRSAIVLFLFAGPLAAAQDSNFTKRLSLSTELILDITREYNLSAEYRFKRGRTAGLMAGIIRPWTAMDNPGLSPSQDDFPGKVYEGIALRPYLKCYRTKNDRTYWGFVVTYKNMRYDSVSFTDALPKEALNYSRNEKASVYGLDVLYGKELSRSGSAFFTDIYFGLGFRVRHREYTTYNSYIAGSPYSRPKPEGSFERTQYYPNIVAGFKIGGSIHHKSVTQR